MQFTIKYIMWYTEFMFVFTETIIIRRELCLLHFRTRLFFSNSSYLFCSAKMNSYIICFGQGIVESYRPRWSTRWETFQGKENITKVLMLVLFSSAQIFTAKKSICVTTKQKDQTETVHKVQTFITLSNTKCATENC